MNSLDITTSHNIVVSVELARLSQRILSTTIDLAILIVFIILASIVGNSELFQYFFIAPVIAFYHLLFEIFNKGQSPGKVALKLRVISLSGEEPSIMDLIMRWMFRPIDITLSVSMVAISFISSTPKKQRVGDLLANTVVVKTNNEDNIDLMTIKKIGADSREIQYAGVTQYNDSDMLLVKQTLKRYKGNQSPANRELVIQLADKIAEDQKVKLKNGDRIKFLQNVLEEYIVQTR